MTDLEFWQLIELIDVPALDGGCEEEALAPLGAALRMKSEAQLFAFEEALSRNLYTIDGEAYANQAGDSGGSSDAFLYIRCYVVAKGCKFYDDVKSDPRRIPKSVEQWCEPLLYIHRAAWADLTGSDQSEWPFEATVSYESGDNKDLWPA